MPPLTLIAALDLDGLIGRDNRLPWHLPADLQHFKQATLDRAIIMGRKTWESLPGLLPRRRHIVLSRNPAYRAEGAEVVSSLDAALALLGDAPEALIIGGAELYRQALPRARRLLLTQVQDRFEGDAWFPAFDPAAWQLIAEEPHPADARNPHAYTFLTYQRRA